MDKNDNKISLDELNEVSGGAGSRTLRCRKCGKNISGMVFLANSGMCPDCFIKANEGKNARPPVF